MARKKDFEKIDYFDDGTFLYYEENIIGKKLKDINKDTYIDNNRKASYLFLKEIRANYHYQILPNSTHNEFTADLLNLIESIKV